MLELIPIKENIGTEVRGIDLREPISDSDFKKIFDAWIDTTILLIRDQHITEQQHLDFTKRFGEISFYTRKKFSEDKYPEILVLTNKKNKEGKPIGSPYSGRVWHTDGHYMENPPSGSIIYCLEAPPEGGDTMFANMFKAYDYLPEKTKGLIDNLDVTIDRVFSRYYNYPKRTPPTEKQIKEWIKVDQPMVKTHPENNKKAIYAGGNVPWGVPGLSHDESDPLVTFVQECSVLEQFVYRHKWRPGDMIVWENRSALHCATPYDEEKHCRLMHRTTFV
jgi:taurine dioxygenase/putative 2-oxoglutarate oxygenase